MLKNAMIEIKWTHRNTNKAFTGIQAQNSYSLELKSCYVGNKMLVPDVSKLEFIDS